MKDQKQEPTSTTKKSDHPLAGTYHFDNGRYWGFKIAKHILKGQHKFPSIEYAIGSKEEFGKQLEANLGYTDKDPDYAENLGIISALKDVLEDPSILDEKEEEEEEDKS